MNRRLLPTVIVSTLLLSACTTTHSRYALTPSREDEHTVAVSITPGHWRDTGMCFTLKNESAREITVDWEHSFLVLKGQAVKCVHDGPYRNHEPLPTTVAPGAELADCLYPAGNTERASDPIDFMSKGMHTTLGGGIARKPMGVAEGRYAIAVVCQGRTEILRGTFGLR